MNLDKISIIFINDMKWVSITYKGLPQINKKNKWDYIKMIKGYWYCDNSQEKITNTHTFKNIREGGRETQEGGDMGIYVYM